MRNRISSLCLALTGITLIAAWAMAQPQTAPSSPGAQKRAFAAPHVFERMGKAKWSPTTYEAATGEVNKKALAAGKPATITGEVVDVSCYLQLGKRGEAHLACGTKCIQHGNPIGIVDQDDNLYILFAEEHHLRRDGQVELAKVFLPYLAQQVEVSGMRVDMKGYRALFVPASELGGTVEAGK